MTWLLDTLTWTGALIAVVLLVRRPVARQFGPKGAYALWFVPLLRLLLPPIVLPAWLAPAPAATAAMVAVPTNTVIAASAAAPDASFPWLSLFIAVWLGGAVIYAAMRLRSYFDLRRELLADAHPVGHAGNVRLVETPATASPLAFGVRDKVVALPPGFMAWTDRPARDLALAHELAHHRAHDLAFNFCALPLFALHWFNPLSLLGWRAMRRDQEAACDARVVERCDRLQRATYAALIASTVAGPRGALAAPMACPVLGDKSIVHRLRNLTMTTPSHRRRRTGALLLGASMLLVPLTASISYAQDEVADAPLPPEPPAAPLAPRAIDAPLAPVEPGAPGAPEAPLPPEAPHALHHGGTYVVEHGHGPVSGERVVIIREERDGKASGHPVVSRKYRVVSRGEDGKFDAKALERQMEALHDRLGNLEHLRTVMTPEEIARITSESRHAARVAVATAPHAPAVLMSCDGKGEVSDTTTSEGRRVIRICQQRAMAPAIDGLRSARAQIARQREMSAETREEVLDRLDREIERLEAAK